MLFSSNAFLLAQKSVDGKRKQLAYNCSERRVGVISDFKPLLTSSSIISPTLKSAIFAASLVDMREFLTGQYDFKIKLLYLNKTEEAQFTGEIVSQAEKDKRAIREEKKIEEKGSKAVIFLIVRIVIAIVLIVFAFVSMFAARRKGGGSASIGETMITKPPSGSEERW